MQARGLQDASRTQTSPFLAEVLSELEREESLELVMATDDDVVAILDDGERENDELVLLREDEEPVRLARMLGEAMTITVAVKTIARAARTRVVCLCMCIFHMLERLSSVCNIAKAPHRQGAFLHMY